MEKALPVGISDFRDIIMDNGYYVDKTMLIADWTVDDLQNVAKKG